MNSLKLIEKLYAMGRENGKYSWAEINGVIQAIMIQYNSRGLDYDAQQAMESMDRFNRTDILSF